MVLYFCRRNFVVGSVDDASEFLVVMGFWVIKFLIIGLLGIRVLHGYRVIIEQQGFN